MKTEENNKSKFLIKKALSFGWHSVEDNFLLFIGLSLSLFLFSFVSGIISGWVNDNSVRYGFLIMTGLHVADIIVGIILTKILLNFIDNKKPFSNINSLISIFPQFLFGNILYFLIILGGFILFIIPGIIWAIKYQFFSYFIVDKNMTAWQALKKSGEITKREKKHLFILSFVFVGINIIGFFAFLLGLFVSIPITWLAMVYVYRKLLKD